MSLHYDFYCRLMLNFQKMTEFSFKLIFDESNAERGSLHKDDIVNTHNQFQECNEHTCYYSRDIYRTREIFENMIINAVIGKCKLAILFYACDRLKQELIIIEKLLSLNSDAINEVHFADVYYGTCSDESREVYYLIFSDFMAMVRKKGWKFESYFHNDPSRIPSYQLFSRRFDLICGLDMDIYHPNGQAYVNNFPIVKNIIHKCLSSNGYALFSRKYTDTVRFSSYRMMSNTAVRQTDIFYVKNSRILEKSPSNLISSICPDLFCSAYRFLRNYYPQIVVTCSNIFIVNLLTNSQIISEKSVFIIPWMLLNLCNVSRFAFGKTRSMWLNFDVLCRVSLH